MSDNSEGKLATVDTVLEKTKHALDKRPALTTLTPWLLSLGALVISIWSVVTSSQNSGLQAAIQAVNAHFSTIDGKLNEIDERLRSLEQVAPRNEELRSEVERLRRALLRMADLHLSEWREQNGGACGVDQGADFDSNTGICTRPDGRVIDFKLPPDFGLQK